MPEATTASAITKVTIIGGGTAGWITAAYLNHRLQWGATKRADVEIVVIESPHIPTIGVGEATVPTLKGTLRLLGISEDEFVSRTAATIKLGIRFDNWQQPAADGTSHSYLSPFTGSPVVAGHDPAASFLAHELAGEMANGGGAPDFYDSTAVVGAAVRALRAPRAIDGAEFGGILQYAYHVDAGLLASFLQEVCVARGVEHVRDDVVGIDRDDRGLITAFHLAQHGRCETELVIDCTGFRGLILNDFLGEPFVSFSDYLLNDRATPVQVLRPDSDVMLPATTATAMGSGWSWRIPLQSRDGTGYVYSSAFCSDEAAADELGRLLGHAERLTVPRRIAMRVGHSRRSWVGNCVAIGASSGFMEPLESTTILGIELAARLLLRNFPSTAHEAPLADRFNAEMNAFYDEVRDFLGLHFALSDREDTPYWRAVRHEAKRSDTLVANLALWRCRLPTSDDIRARAVFGSQAIAGLLIGKGFYRDSPPAGTGAVSQDAWRRHRRDMDARKMALLAALPGHRDLLAAMRARTARGTTVARGPRADVNLEAVTNDVQLLRRE